MKDSFKELLKKGEIEPSQGFTERLMLKIEVEKKNKLSAHPEVPIRLPFLLLGILAGCAGFLLTGGELYIADYAIELESVRTPLFVLFAFLLVYAFQRMLIYRVIRKQ